MYNEIAGREFARYRMREAQQAAQNARLLASLKGDSSKEAGQSAVNHPRISIQHVLQMVNLRGDLAGSE